MRYTYATWYQIKACCMEPLHIGAAMEGKGEILVRPESEIPFIQSSSLAGAIRAVIQDTQKAEKLFGSIKKEGCLHISDGTFEEDNCRLEERPHVKLDAKYGVAADGAKFNMQYIAAGSTFSFDICLLEQQRDSEMEAQLRLAMAAMNDGCLRLGGKKTSGCGSLKLEDVRFRTYDLCGSEQDREDWLEHSDAGMQTLQLPSVMQDVVRFHLVADIKDQLLIGGIGSLTGEEDIKSVQNARNEYIIPGSSIKGAMRSHVERILHTQNLPMELADTAFGCASAAESGKMGCVFFPEITIEQPTVVTTNRIHINRFTGGTIDGALFNEETVWGKLRFSIVVNRASENKAACGVILWALRDLALGIFGFGGGSAIGRGNLKVQNIEAQRGNGETIAKLQNNQGEWQISSGAEWLDDVVRAIREVKV